MAGDWIKMRVDLPDDPAVVSIALALEIDEDSVVGKLHRLWSWADKHTTDGRTNGVNLKWVDRFVGKTGFAQAMIATGWLCFDSGELSFPGFERHNGESAKRRADNTLRVRASRERRARVAPRTQIPRSFVRYVLARDKKTCVYCGIKEGESINFGQSRASVSVDHIMPDSRGGSTAVENLATACVACNMEKSDRTPDEARMQIKHLQEGVILKDNCNVIVTRDARHICDDNATREEREESERENQTLNSEWKANGSAGASGNGSAPAAGHSRLRSQKWFFVREGRTLANLEDLDWSRVCAMAEAAAKRIPARTTDDRRMWFRYAVLAATAFSEDWLIGAADSVFKAKETKRTKQAHFVAVLKARAIETFCDRETLAEMLGSIEIPDDVWNSSAVEIRK